ncbi:hypothetical protein Taro_026157 [Colocasia esculenta]|uniref:Uncharacterized protein n=1 Tax=Colocasia esculenta TaxID=4460 RepID=A0A843VAP4_COLES|nr:hypothetical protein [Colocasia esculenta]
MPIPQPFFPSYNRTPKHHSYLNTLHQTLGTSFRTCWGRVEEFLVARELWINHKKLIFFRFSSAATCTNHLLRVELRSKRRPCERDGPIGRVLRSCRDSQHCRDLIAAKRSVAIVLPDLTAQSHSSQHPVAFWSRPVAILIWTCRDLTPGLIAHVAFLI